MKKVVGEFKSFIARGNVIDIAIGMIIGTAFSKIVSSLVNDVFMPVLGLVLGSMNLSALKIVFIAANEAAGVKEVAMNIGMFIGAVIDFLLIALVLFLLVKIINKFRDKKEKEKEKEPEAPPPSEEVQLLTEIRDLLRK